MTTTTGPPGSAPSSASDGGRSRALARSRGDPVLTHQPGRPAPRHADRVRPTAGVAPGPAPSSTFVAAEQNVERLLRVLAPLLGLELSRVDVTVLAGDGDPHGRAKPGGIELTGDLLSARTAAIVVHELAHARQHA
ncbi:MAG: hypothetical protein WAS07_12595, partial [Micropruina sp.]